MIRKWADLGRLQKNNQDLCDIFYGSVMTSLLCWIMHLKYVIILFTTLLIKTKLSCLTFVININIAMCLFVIKGIWYYITRWMLLMQWLCYSKFPVVYITLIYDLIHLVDQYIIKVISHSHSCLVNRTKYNWKQIHTRIFVSLTNSVCNLYPLLRYIAFIHFVK